MDVLECGRVGWVERRRPRARLGAFAFLAAGALAAAAAAWRLGPPRALARWQAPPVRVSDFVSGIPGAREDLRLVVATLDVNKNAMAESRKELFGLDLGVTRVSLSVPARVHFAVDLTGPKPVDFRLHAANRELVAIFPPPAVQAVEVFTQGKRVTTETGWARLRSRSGRALEDGLERGLYASLRAEASSPAVLEQIKEKARPVLQGLLNDYLKRAGALGPGGIAHTRIRFLGDADAEALALAPGTRRGGLREMSWALEAR